MSKKFLKNIDLTAKQRKSIKDLLRQHLPGVEAWAYGSRAKFSSRPNSDLDMVVFATPEQKGSVANLAEAFEESDLPFRVDLFVWDEVSEAFHKNIEERVVLQGSAMGRNGDSEWKTTTVGEFCPFAYGKSLPKKKRQNGSVPVYGSNGPVGFHSKACVDEPGIVIGRKGSAGAVHFSRGPFWPIDTAFYVTETAHCDLRFAYYLLKSIGLEQMNADSAVPGLNREAAHSRQIKVPPLPEQHAIAHILGTLDDKIELNRRMSETLEAMAQALFKSWFIDFDPVRAKAEGRDTGLPKHIADLFPDCLVPSDLGLIPEGWEVKCIEDIADLTKGRSYKSSELADSSTALVTLKSFARGGGYRIDGLKPFTGIFKQEQIVNPGEVIVACTDVTQAADVIGRSAVVQPDPRYDTLVASLDVIIVRPACDSMNNAFLYFLMKSDAFVNHALAYTTGTTVLHMDKRAIPSFSFACPQQEVLDEFSKTARPAFDQIQLAGASSRELDISRDTLLPSLISGAVRVKCSQ